MSPQPGKLLDPGQVITISAKIPSYKALDPKSVGIALLSMTGSLPYAYDAQSGMISLDINEGLTGTLQRALVWATDVKSGRRFEASWTFRLPDLIGDPAFCPPIDPGANPFRATQASAPGAASVSSRPQAAGAPRLQN